MIKLSVEIEDVNEFLKNNLPMMIRVLLARKGDVNHVLGFLEWISYAFLRIPTDLEFAASNVEHAFFLLGLLKGEKPK